MEPRDSSNNISSHSNRRFRFVLIALLFIAAIVKSYLFISGQSGGTIVTALVIFKSDLFILGITLLLLVLDAFADIFILRFFAATGALLTALLYIGDAVVIVRLGQRLYVEDLWKFAGEIGTIVDLANYSHITLVVVLFFTFLLRVSVSKKALSVSFGAALFCIAVSFVPLSVSSSADARFSKNLASEWLRAISRPRDTSYYNIDDVRKFSAQYHGRKFAQPFDLETNIILVIVESLSNFNSKQITGIYDYLPELERISTHGMLFTNFFANHEASEGGVVALLGGYPPLHYPRSTRNIHVEFGVQKSAVLELKELGFHTEFLASTPIDFLQKKRFLGGKGVAFAEFRGREEVPRFKEAPKFAFESPSDEVLYEELVSRVEILSENKNPFFYAVVTGSSHFPYVDPLGRKPSETTKWGYVDSRLGKLFDELQDRNFFESGVLLITGDHRNMGRIRPTEEAIYGESAKARVPLVVVGKNIPNGKVDKRFFQQSDLLRKLSEIADTQKPLSPNPVWVERYTIVQGKREEAGNIMIFDEATEGKVGYAANLSGKHFNWLGDKPHNFEEIETRLHRQRAAHQAGRENMQKLCSPDWLPRALSPSVSPGLSFTQFDGIELEDLQRAGSKRTLKSTTINTLDLMSLKKMDLESTRGYAIQLRGFIQVELEGDYWLKVHPGDGGCIAIDRELVLSAEGKHYFGFNESKVRLSPGLHQIDIKFYQQFGTPRFKLEWLRPSEEKWEVVPSERLLVPVA